jgi:hypothetical protein
MGGKWECTYYDCAATALVAGDPWYKTLDGTTFTFTFDGDCKYVLMQTMSLNNQS